MSPMAAAALTPLRIMVLCDGARESNAEAGVFHLKGVRQGMTARDFTFVPSHLWLFVLQERGSDVLKGEMPFAVTRESDEL
jgi:hypothetical protein